MKKTYVDAFNNQTKMVMNLLYHDKNITILLILFFNIYQLTKKLKTQKLFAGKMNISLTRLHPMTLKNFLNSEKE